MYIYIVCKDFAHSIPGNINYYLNYQLSHDNVYWTDGHDYSVKDKQNIYPTTAVYLYVLGVPVEYAVYGLIESRRVR